MRKEDERAYKLANTPIGSGHNNFLIGITVQFDLCYPQYWTKHLQRYHWFQYFSGQSIMHTLTKVPKVLNQCNRWVLEQTADKVDELIKLYNTNELIYPFYLDYRVKIENKKDLFHAIVSNTPAGYELWQPVTTNYMQLKTMYFQRKTSHEHKLYDWKEFCDWIETLEMSNLITGK